MYFEEYHGFKPGLWLHHPTIDEFLATNAFRVQPWESKAALALGLRISMIRLMVASIFSIVAGLGHRSVPSCTGRLLYSFLTGFLLLYYPFGNQVALCFVPLTLLYVAMLVAPTTSGKLSWWITFVWLLGCMERTGDLWDSGEVDITGALMVLTLKLIAICHNLSDGRSRRAAAFSEERRSLLIGQPPGPLEYLAYLFASGNLLAGPFFEFTEFKDFVQRTGPFSRAWGPGMLRHALLASSACIVKALLAVSGHLLLNMYIDPFQLTAPRVWHYTLFVRYLLAFALGAPHPALMPGLVVSRHMQIAFVGSCSWNLHVYQGASHAAISKRCSYYFIWFLSEAGLNASGFGFNGFKDTEGKESLHDRYQNADFVQVESCDSMAAIPRYWNINTGKFLRRYVYERVGGGFVGLTLTQIVSALWHGMREGFLAYFLMTIPLFQASKVLYKQEKHLPPQVWRSRWWRVLKWAVGHAENNVFCQPFMTMRLSRFWSTWQAFHFGPHLIVLALCVLGIIAPPPPKHAINGTRESKAKAA